MVSRVALDIDCKVFSTSAVTAGKNIAYHSSAVGLGVGADVGRVGSRTTSVT